MKLIKAIKVFAIIVSFFYCSNLTAQLARDHYTFVFNKLLLILSGADSLKFKNAVFVVENAYFDNQLSEGDFENNISFISDIVKIKNTQFNRLGYNFKDSVTIKCYSNIFKIITDTSTITARGKSLTVLPCQYNFDDMFGEKDWSNMFVSKLLATHRGNCHSMPYLYKILCDELGIPCHLALSPNHIYIKHRSEKVGWYNTELTSASFPIDAWIMASGYITLEAIQNGIYMDALDDKKCVTLCVYDLAKGFDRKYPDNDGTFIIKCCDLALEHFPNFINALILKAETKKKQFERMMRERSVSTALELTQQTDGKVLWDDFTKLYVMIHNLGYRSMPEKMYLDWLLSLKKEREKYSNKQVSEMNKN